METARNAQRTPNAVSLVAFDEALWRLNITPLAAELASILPSGALVGHTLVDLRPLTGDRADAAPAGIEIVGPGSSRPTVR